MNTDITSATEQIQLKKLKKFQAAGFFSSLPEGVTCKRATTVSELRGAYNLVYDSFLEANFILPNKGQMRVRPFETSSDTATYICKKEDRIVGAFSGIMDSPELKLPSDTAFGPELDALRNEGAFVCEMSNQATIPEYRKTSVTSDLMRCVFAHAWHYEVTDLVCSISPSQRKFYEMMGFKQVGEIKSYSDIVYDPVALMRLEDIQGRWMHATLDDDTLDAFWKRFGIVENPYLSAIPFWTEQSNLLFNDPWRLAAIFEGCEEMFENATAAERLVLEERLGATMSILHIPGLETIVNAG